MARATLNVPDISCEHCERTITQALTPLAGVESVRVDIPQKQVHVAYDPKSASIDRFREVLDDEAYPVASATEEVS